MSYDGAGNPTTYRSAALTFDPENRMAAYGSALTNAYSGDGLRAWKQTGGVKTYFLYDGDQPVAEYTASGSPPTASLLAATTYGADGLVSRRTSGVGTVCYLFDERGNVSQRTSSTGTVLGSDLYDAYGSRTGTASQPDPFGFEAQAGYYTDAETGLILCTHRFYDPGVGRFINRDPMGYMAGVNLYGYARNSPINHADPSGLATIGITIGAGAGGGLFGLGGGSQGSVGIAIDTSGNIGITWDTAGYPVAAGFWGGAEFNLTYSDGNLSTPSSCGCGSIIYTSPPTAYMGGQGFFGPVQGGVSFPINGDPPTYNVGARLPPEGGGGFGTIGTGGGVGISGSAIECEVDKGIQGMYPNPTQLAPM